MELVKYINRFPIRCLEFRKLVDQTKYNNLTIDVDRLNTRTLMDASNSGNERFWYLILTSRKLMHIYSKSFSYKPLLGGIKFYNNHGSIKLIKDKLIIHNNIIELLEKDFNLNPYKFEQALFDRYLILNNDIMKTIIVEHNDNKIYCKEFGVIYRIAQYFSNDLDHQVVSSNAPGDGWRIVLANSISKSELQACINNSLNPELVIIK